MFNKNRPDDVENWVCIYETTTEYDANLAKSYLESREIDVRIISKRDSAFDLNIGDLALIYVYVTKGQEDEAHEAMREWKSGESDLGDGDEENENKND